MIKKVVIAIDELAIDPHPEGSKKLKGGSENLWRIRIGDYRVIYLIEDTIKVVEIRNNWTQEKYLRINKAPSSFQTTGYWPPA